MKLKQILVLGVILGALALGIFLKSWVRSAREGSNVVSPKSAVLAVPDPAKIERILIGRGVETAPVELARENGVWRIKTLWNSKANPAKVETLVQKLGSLRGELRGTGKDLFGDFGIGAADSFSIKCLGTGGVTLLDINLGTQQAGGEGCFIRKASAEDVYWMDLDPAELLGTYADLGTAKPSGDAWADLRLFNLDPEKVTKITLYMLKGGEKTQVMGLERMSDPADSLKHTWKFLRTDMKLPIDPEKVLKYIAILTSVRAQKVVDPEGEGYGLEKPVWQLAVASEDKQKMILNAGPKDMSANAVYVQHLKGSTVWNLDLSSFDDLNVDDTYFVKEIPAPPAAGTLPSEEDLPQAGEQGQAA